MEFIKEIKQKFIEAGWKPDRSVFDLYKTIYKVEEFPGFLKDFLKEYGNLVVSDCAIYKSEVINKLKIIVDYGGFEEEEDYQYYLNLLKTPLYPFAIIEPDGYRIACDADGKVYMLGDYTFLIADNLKEGIEILIKDNWSKGYSQLDEKTGNWVKDKKWSE